MIPNEIFGIEINTKTVALVFTAIFALTVFWYAFLGFLRGRKKSFFYLIMTTIIFGLGLGLMNPIANLILKSNMGSVAQEVNNNFGNIVSAEDSYAEGVIKLLHSQLPSEAAAYITLEGNVGAVIYGLMGFIVKIVYVILFIILAFTVLKILTDIIWLIVRPKTKAGRRKSFGSRMGGFLIGTLKGVFYSLLFFAIFAGIASVAKSAKQVLEAEEGGTAVVVLTDKEATLVQVDSGSSATANEAIEILDLLGSYRESVPGKLFNLVKIKSVPLDEFFFDAVFSFDVKLEGQEKVTVKFRKELVTVANAFAYLQNILEIDPENFDLTQILDAIASASDAQKEQIKVVVNDLVGLDLIKVVLPASIEVAIATDQVKNMLPEGVSINANELANALIHDINTIGYTLVDAASVIKNFISGTEITVNDFLNLDSSVVKMIFDKDHLGGIETLDVLAPIAITYLASEESISESLSAIGIDLSKLANLEDGASWADELKNIGEVYEVMQDILKDPETGRVEIDLENLDYSELALNFTEEKVNELAKALFNSHLISSSVTDIIRTTVDNYFSDYISISEDYVFDKEELACLLRALSNLATAGILDKGEDGTIDFVTNIANLSDESVASVAHNLAASKLLTSSLKDFFSRADSLDLLPVRLGSFDGWDDAEKAEIELAAILSSAKVGVKVYANIDKETGLTAQDFAELSLDDFDTLLRSKIVMGTIVNYLTDNAKAGESLEVLASGVSEVNKMQNWFDSTKLTEKYEVTSTGITISPLNLDKDVEELVDTYLVYKNSELVGFVYITDNRNIAYPLEINEDDQIEVYGIHQGELRNILMAVYRLKVNLVEENVSFKSESLFNDLIKCVKEENVSDLSKSTIVSFAICSALDTYVLGEDGSIKVPAELEDKDNPGHVDPYKWMEEKETYNALMAVVKVLAGVDLTNLDVNSIKLKPILDNKEYLFKSIFVVGVVRDLLTGIDVIKVPDVDSLKTIDGWKDELNTILGIVPSIIEINDETTVSGITRALNISDLSMIINAKDELLKSVVLTETAKALIVDNVGESLNIPADLKSAGLDVWGNEYDSEGNITKRGELQHLLDAVSAIFPDGQIDLNNITSTLKIGNLISDDAIEAIASSKIISIVVKDNVGSIVSTVPEPLKVDDAWLGENGEVSRLLHALQAILGNAADNLTINDLSSLTSKIDFGNMLLEENRSKITSSMLVVELLMENIGSIVETLPESIDTFDEWYGETGEAANIMAVLSILIKNPSALKVDDLSNISSVIDFNALLDSTNTNTVCNSNLLVEFLRQTITDAGLVETMPDEIKTFDGWYGEGKEASAVLGVLGVLLGDDANINLDNIANIASSIDFNSLLDSANTNKIISSMLIVELLREKITDAGLVATMPDEIKTFDGWYGEDKEASAVLGVLGVLLGDDANISLDNIANITSSINFGNLLDSANTNKIISSLLIVELLREKITDAELVEHMPENLNSFESWEGETGEAAKILRVLNVLIKDSSSLDLSNLGNITQNISFGNLVKPENRATVISSSLIVKMFKEKVADSNAMCEVVPLVLEQFSAWEGPNGETARLLNALYYILGDNADNLDLSNLSGITSSVNLARLVGEHRNEITASYIITELIKEKVIGLVEYVPSGLSSVSGSLSGWLNTGSGEDELSHLLAAINILLKPKESDSIDNLNFDSLKLFDLIDNRNEILKSKIITQIIMEKISSINDIKRPSTLVLTSQEGWKNEYSGESITSYGELSHLLRAIGKLLGITSTSATTLDGLSVDVNLYNVIHNCDEILHSEIMSLTIQDKLCEMDMLTKPVGWDDSESANHIIWANSYDGEDVTYSGEIKKIFMAMDKLISITPSTTLDDLSSFDYANIFDEEKQNVIFASAIVSETVITKITEISALSIPAIYGLKDVNNRSAWTTGEELKYFFRALNVILPESAKSDLTVNSSDISAEKIYSKLVNGSTRTTLLQSYIMADTLALNFKDSLSSNIPSETNAGIDLNVSSNWYGIGEERTVEEKELWCLVESLKHIVGEEGFTSDINIDINAMLADEYFMPTLDSNKLNTNSAIHDLFNSKIVEEMFVEPVADLISDNLSEFIVAPTDGYKWYRHTSTTEHDLQTVLESVFLLEGKETGLKYTEMEVSKDSIDNLNASAIADAYCVSRVFKGSIEKTFTELFKEMYETLHVGAMLFKPAEASAIAAWDNEWFSQVNYNGLTNYECHELLKTNIQTVIDNIESMKALVE